MSFAQSQRKSDSFLTSTASAREHTLAATCSVLCSTWPTRWRRRIGECSVVEANRHARRRGGRASSTNPPENGSIRVSHQFAYSNTFTVSLVSSRCLVMHASSTLLVAAASTACQHSHDVWPLRPAISAYKLVRALVCLR